MAFTLLSSQGGTSERSMGLSEQAGRGDGHPGEWGSVRSLEDQRTGLSPQASFSICYCSNLDGGHARDGKVQWWR